MIDWNRWLARYDRPGSPHSRRLTTVRRVIDRHLDRTAPDSVRALSLCAGDGRDLLHVLAERSDPGRVSTTLIEYDPDLCTLARAKATECGLAAIDVRQADAGHTDTYAGLPKADLVIMVGVFGNISDEDVEATLDVLPALCNPRALVVWSLRQIARRVGSGRFPNDSRRVAKIDSWLGTKGFEASFANRSDAVFHVGAHRFVGTPASLEAGRRFFKFGDHPV